MLLRHAQETDYNQIISVVNEWWGKPMTDQLPKLFLKHFKSTSIVAEENGQIIGFVIGFISQDHPEQAYIHFTGIHPEHRKTGIARTLYNNFFDLIKAKNCSTVRGLTASTNKNSVAFHTKMGFQIEKGDTLRDGLWIHTNYDGPNIGDRILFVKNL